LGSISQRSLPYFPVTSWAAVGLAIFLHWVTVAWEYAGFSPALSPRSFQTPKWLEYFLVLRDARCQGAIRVDWDARIHHLHSDQTADPQIPIRASGGATCLDDSSGTGSIGNPRFIKDIADDPVYQFVQNILS